VFGMQKPLLLLVSAGCLISCHKEVSNPVNTWSWYGNTNPAVYNYVLINASQVVSKSDSSEYHIDLSAAFIDSNNHQITVVNTLSVNNQIIQPGRDSTYSYDYGSLDMNKGSMLFGTNVLVTIHGTADNDSVTSSVYIPKQLSSVVTNYPDILSLSKGVQLNWSTDAENAWGNVIIQIFYYSDLSRKSDSTLPQKISTSNLTVPDNGSYFLNKNDLKSFPPNAYVGITIARGTQNEALLPVSHKRIFYFSSASVSSVPVKLTH
jgi:hypothetical protein